MNNSEQAKSQLKGEKVNNTGGSTEIIKEKTSKTLDKTWTQTTVLLDKMNNTIQLEINCISPIFIWINI